jgi:beta-glucosidase
VGETKTITFVIDNEKLSFYNEKLEFKSEAGDFDLMIGASSEDIRLKSSFELLP